MAWVPKRKFAVPEQTRKTRFIGNATGNTNSVANTGMRYSPRSPSVNPVKGILKQIALPEPDTTGYKRPGLRLRNMAPAFQKMILMRLSKKNQKLAKKLNKVAFTRKNLQKLQERQKKQKKHKKEKRRGKSVKKHVRRI